MNERKEKKTEIKLKKKKKLARNKQGQKGAQGKKRKGVSRGAKMSENEMEERG